MYSNISEKEIDELIRRETKAKFVAILEKKS